MNNKIFCKYHPDSIIIDNSSVGDILCKECALVITERNYGDVVDNTYECNDIKVWSYTDIIKEVCAKLHLCDAIKNDAIYYFQLCYNKSRLRNLRKKELAMAAIYNATKRSVTGILPKQIAFNAGADANLVTKYAEEMCDQLDLKVVEVPPNAFLAKFRYCLDLDFEDESLANFIISGAEENFLIGHRESDHVAVIALCMASLINGNPKTKEEIKNFCPISNQTLNSIYKDLYTNINLILPKDLLCFSKNLPETIK